MTNLKETTLHQLTTILLEMGYKEYRAKQIFKWIYLHHTDEFYTMTDISKEMQKKLDKIFFIPGLEETKRIRAKDGSIKFLFKLPDNEYIESVYIPEESRRTICISTQVGCALGCDFCATGKIGLIRNLEKWEIIDQILKVQQAVNKRISNVVMMGMGEPLANIDNVSKAILLMNKRLKIGARKITISTAGLVPEIYKIATLPLQFRLAISLNAPEDKLRNQLMPINKRYPIDELLRAGAYFAKTKNLRVTLEYIVFEGLNHSKNDAELLAALAKKLPGKINLIPYNPVSNSHYKRPSIETVQRFKDILSPIASTVTVRWSSGEEINAACGQLRAEY